jgi:hypothetical protein
MKADLEMNLVHDGVKWIARNHSIAASGHDFSQLDANLVDVLQNSHQFPTKTQVTVFMGFDFDTIPIRLRQYASHYFNRYVSLEL